MADEMELTSNLSLKIPPKGYRDWDVPLNENFKKIDTILEILYPVGGGSI